MDEWQSMELTETRSQGGLRLRNNLAKVTVQVSEALRQLITGETTVQEPGEMIPMVRVQPGERNGEKRLLQSHLTVNSGRDRQRLAGWPKILKLLGAEEAHIMALTELAVELEAWQEEPNDHGIIKKSRSKSWRSMRTGTRNQGAWRPSGDRRRALECQASYG